MRAFIGIGLSDTVRVSLGGLQRELTASGADVKWVEPDNLHVTLKFLGEISEAHRDAVAASLNRIAESESPLLLHLDRVGAFPSTNAPRVIWVGLGEGKDAVARIAEQIEQDAAALSLRQEDRPFAAHLTLGRVRSSRRLRQLAETLRATTWTPPEPWRVSAVTLYQSVLSSSGPRYTVLAELPLRGPQ